MPMLLQPIEGQPGLFAHEADASLSEGELSAVRYGGTRTFVRTRRNALEGLAGDPFYVLGAAGSIAYKSQPVRSGEVQGLNASLVFLYYQGDERVPRSLLESAAKATIGATGLEILSTSFDAQTMGYSWQKINANTWDAVVNGGPSILLNYHIWRTGETPTSEDNAALPVVADVYSVDIRAGKGVTQADVKTVANALTTMRDMVNSQYRLAAPYLFITSKGVPAPTNWVLWSLLGVGAIGAISMMGSSNYTPKP